MESPTNKADRRERIARLCCYWADPVKNGTCHDAYCSSSCHAVLPEKQFFDMADAILADDPSQALAEALEKIAAPKFGLQGLIEEGAADNQIAAYWRKLAQGYEDQARAALKAFRGEP